VTDDPSTRLARCRTCDAPIFWCTFVATGTRAPIDYDPVPDGNIVIVGTAFGGPTIDVVREEAALFGDDRPHYTNHFATCPQADEWRRR
jgi:hypothetical protein